MKEAKVYVSELPESCWDCFCQDSENGRCKILGKYTDYVPKDCPLIDIKTHDRELVKEVCEKIRKEIESQTDVRIAVNNFNTITGHGLEYVFRRMQKEFENV